MVVVDDCSSSPIASSLSSRFPAVRFIRNEARVMLACSRNAGAAASRGDFFFFLDDDNVVAPDAMRLLVEALRPERSAVSAPIIYYLARPETVWTSVILKGRFPGFYRLHTDIPGDIVRTFSFHNSFMVKRRVFEQLNGFDCHLFPVRFSEVDFAHKIELAGFDALVTPNAKDWHDLGWSLVHVDSDRAYYTERNRMIIIKKYYRKRDFRFYALCILPLIATYQLVHHMLSTTDGRIRTGLAFLRGVASGLSFKAKR